MRPAWIVWLVSAPAQWTAAADASRITRGYGELDADGAAPVTPETLFQAVPPKRRYGRRLLRAARRRAGARRLAHFSRGPRPGCGPGPSDLARFAAELQKAWAGNSRVLWQRMARQMLTPHSGGYELGIGVEDGGRSARFSHGGANRERLIMTNGDRGAAPAQQVIGHVAAAYDWPATGAQP